MELSIAKQRPPRRRVLRLLMVSALLIAGVSTAAVVHVDAYGLTPGSATSIGPRMTFTPPQSEVGGEVSMVDVNISQMTMLGRFVAELTGGPRHFPGAAFGFHGTNGFEQYFAQSYLTMDQAKHDAVIAAFRATGEPIAKITTGLLVYDATTSSSLKLGDFLETVNGQPVTSTCGLANALKGVERPVATLRRGHLDAATGALDFGPTTSVTLHKAKRPQALVTLDGTRCAEVPTTRFGISTVNIAHLELTSPKVTIDTTQIGGPSAGFAMALSLVNQLQHGQLLHGRAVAATGTIDAEGNIGDVGGVPEKAVAVGNANLSVFFVPQVEVDTARLHAPKGVRVIGVSSLGQAIAALKSG